jgi:hypothetical protein
MAAADVLDERVSGGDYLYAAELFEPAHRLQSGLQPSVIGFNRVVSVLLGDMTGGRRQLFEHWERVRLLWLVARDADRGLVRAGGS